MHSLDMNTCQQTAPVVPSEQRPNARARRRTHETSTYQQRAHACLVSSAAYSHKAASGVGPWAPGGQRGPRSICRTCVRRGAGCTPGAGALGAHWGQRGPTSIRQARARRAAGCARAGGRAAPVRAPAPSARAATAPRARCPLSASAAPARQRSSSNRGLRPAQLGPATALSAAGTYCAAAARTARQRVGTFRARHTARAALYQHVRHLGNNGCASHCPGTSAHIKSSTSRLMPSIVACCDGLVQHWSSAWL